MKKSGVILKGDNMSMHKDKKSGNPMMNGGKPREKMQRKMDGLTPAQKKLPPALQAAILKKMKSK